MERLRAVALLEVGCERAESLLQQYFESRRTPAGTVEIPVRVTLDDFALPVHLGFHRDVIVGVHRRRDEQNLNDELAVEWSPEPGGMFAPFRGRIIACPHPDTDQPCLELDGHYEPPHGNVVGEAFDLAVGHAILQRTADAFLRELAEAIRTLHASSPISP